MGAGLPVTKGNKDLFCSAWFLVHQDSPVCHSGSLQGWANGNWGLGWRIQKARQVPEPKRTPKISVTEVWILPLATLCLLVLFEHLILQSVPKAVGGKLSVSASGTMLIE